MSRLAILPAIMVAPNGARRGKSDHPALPVTIAETVATARACHAQGAGAIHAHVRDDAGAHVLDTGLYGELLVEMAHAVPSMPVQITTEAAGRYSAAQQRQFLTAMLGAMPAGTPPEAVSVALAELLADGDRAAARRSYHALAEAGVAVQHILYDADQVRALASEIALGTLPAPSAQTPLSVLYVLGRYSADEQSDPAMLHPFLTAAKAAGLTPDWAVCAFGPSETACLRTGFAKGGKVRAGFENSLWMDDGTLAPDNAARIREVAQIRKSLLCGA